MNEPKSLIHQSIWRVIDHTALGPQFDALQSFGIDDTLCASIGSGHAPATARAWVHHPTIVLGIQDTKLPYLQSGLNYLYNHGYNYIVRNSGGLAVVLDEGVLNLTLIFPETENRIDINRGYEAMWSLVKQMFHDIPLDIEAREIKGSYCPGSYDLNMLGKKFAGISQRRLQHGVAVQCYLCVQGSGQIRAAFLKEFYKLATKDESTIAPEIDPEVMASLSELLGVDLTIDDVMDRFLQSLKANSYSIESSHLTDHEQHLNTYYFERVVARNQTLMEK
jgi:octanoyl-[GcvH]:protein N-octanoyltransferase